MTFPAYHMAWSLGEVWCKKGGKVLSQHYLGRHHWNTLSHKKPPIYVVYFLVLLKWFLDFLLLVENEYETVLEQGNTC